jgi:hypothetical protein
MLKKMIIASAALALVASPAVAAAPAASLSVARASANVEGNELGGGLLSIVGSLVSAIAFYFVVLDDDNASESP